MAKTTPVKSTTKKGEAKKKKASSWKKPPPSNNLPTKRKAPPRPDYRLENLSEPLPSLPPLSNPIRYLEGKLTSDCKCYFFREHHPDTDWKDNLSIKKHYKPFSHLGNLVPPVCLLMDAANDQDRLIILNWWRFKTQEEQKEILNDLRNTYAHPKQDNRLLPSDYWERIKLSNEMQAAKKAKEVAAAAAPPPTTGNSAPSKFAPRPVPCLGWSGEKYQTIFQYALEKFSQQPANVCNIQTSAEVLTRNLPLFFSQAKNATDLRFCIETVTVKEVESSNSGASASAAEFAVGTQVSKSAVATSTAAAPATSTAEKTTAATEYTNETTAASASASSVAAAATRAPSTSSDNTKNSGGVAAAAPATIHNTGTRTKQIYVLKSKHCEGVIHRTNYQRQYRCNACKKHNTLVQNLRELSQSRLQRSTAERTEKRAKLQAQLSAALKRESRLRARVKKYREELRVFKKKEYRRKVSELKRKGLWPPSEGGAAASRSQRQPLEDDSTSSGSDDDEDHDSPMLRQQQQQQLHRFMSSPGQRQQQHHLQMQQQQTDRYWEAQQQLPQHQQQHGIHYTARGLFH